MKTLKSMAIVLGLIALLAGTTSNVKAQDDYYQDNNADGNNISLQTFYDELSPYGTWIQDPQYGYVWRPDVDQSDFRPYYSNGRWAMTEYGNTWVSNYDWGWAPFHYGRWVYNTYREWIWLPDTKWGPAWVDWRSGNGYYGWAPMSPNISINLSFGRRYAVPDFCWNFIPQASIYVNLFPRYNYGRNNIYMRNTTIINNTYIYNRRSYYGGPRIEDIRRATNRNVTVYRFDQGNRPGASRIDSRSVSIYRPRPERNAVDNRSAAPRKFEDRNLGSDRNRNQTVNRDPRTDNNRNNQNNRVGNTPNTRDGNFDRNNQNTDNRNSGGQITRTDRSSADQGKQQRDAQVQQQRSQQEQQQRTQRDAQVQQQRSQQEQQQRTQRDAQVQQQRSQQEQQQRTQRDAQVQQQRSQQEQQQRTQRDAQVQQQRSQQEQRTKQEPQQQQQSNTRTESGRPSRGGK